jgi:hypothetical protein
VVSEISAEVSTAWEDSAAVAVTTAEVAVAAEVATTADVAVALAADVATADDPETSADVTTSSEVAAAAVVVDTTAETAAEADLVKFPFSQSMRHPSLMEVHSSFERTLASLQILDAARQSALQNILGL